MESFGDKRLKSESVPIKREPGVFIKSEFQPSLASLPMAPASTAKKEPTQDQKSHLAGIPEYHDRDRDRGGRSRRRYGGNSLVHRVDGYHIRAHYGHGNVDFTITKDTNKTRELKWIEIEREMFRKFHRARFYIEPIERPGASQLQLCSDTGTRTLKFSIRVRQISGRTAFEDHDHSTFQITIPKGKATETKDSISLGSSFTTKAPQSEA